MGLIPKISFKQETKAAPAVAFIGENTRDGINKSYMPKYLWKPPFGYPRFSDIPALRELAKTPYCDMCISGILDKVASIPWDIVIEDGKEGKYKDKDGNITEAKQKEIDIVKSFFENPNTNPHETFEDVFIRMPGRDMLELGSSVHNKIFNLKQEMVEVVCRDAGTFTMNPDIHSMMTNREDILLQQEILEVNEDVLNPFMQLSAYEASHKAAYFQYGFLTSPMPVPFGKREIIWINRSPRTDELYPISPVAILRKSLQLLIYAVESDLEYFNDNNLPKGVLGIDGSDVDELNAFKDQWNTQLRKKDELGQYRKMFHRIPIVGRVPAFTRLEFSSQEMQIIEKQKWYSKMVWAMFGVTPSELGYTEDAAGTANQIIQSKVFRDRAIMPMVRKFETSYNKQIVAEFPFEDLKFKFLTFDIDEEKSKAELYEKQIINGIKTVNEIRQIEGDEPVEWGDDPPKNWQTSENQNNFYMNNDNPGKDYNDRKKDAMDTDENGKKVPKTNNPRKTAEGLKALNDSKRKAIKDYQKKTTDFMKQNNISKSDLMHFTAEQEEEKCNTEKKAQDPSPSQNPLLMDEGERPADDTIIESAILKILDESEDKIKELLDREGKTKPVITQIKSLRDFIDGIKGVISFRAIKTIVDDAIYHSYMEGHDQAEKEKDMVFPVNKDAIGFIQDYTFDNVKDMTTEISNDLRAELQRGYMAGEGIADLKQRVSKVFDVGENRSEMIARTETNRAFNFGKLNAYKASGLKVKKYISIVDDDRTSDISKAMDRKYGSPDKAIPLDQNFKVTVRGKIIEAPCPPFHINERDILMFTAGN